jgi:excinuclease ABC subunit C
MVGAMVVLENGELKKSDYRKFKIRNNKDADDTKALSEVLTRRLAHTEWPMPNLIVVDGGRAQMNAMQKVLKENEINIPVVSVVKDERHKPKDILEEGTLRRTSDKFKFKYEKEILLSNAEAHRFAIGFHKRLRSKFLT